MKTDAWNPGQYEKFKNERTAPFSDLMALVEKKPDMRVIDLGCGTGELTAELHRHLSARKTCGLDSSSEMLRKASSVVTEGLRFEQADIQIWNQDGDQHEAYDLIFSNAALQWCDDHVGLFRRFRKAMKPGGQIAIQMPMNQDYPTHTVARKMAAEMSNALGGAGLQEAMLPFAEYAALLYRLGFKRQQVFVKVYGHELESREDVAEWVKGTTLTLFKNKLSNENYAKFLDEYRVRLFKELPDERPFFYSFKRVFIWGSLS